MTDIESMTKEQMIEHIKQLQKIICTYKEKYEWTDRMGGQFSEWELTRRGDEFS